MFAAPAALTVCSGSAFAQASSTLGCVKQQTDQPAFNVGTTTTYVRVPLWKKGSNYYVTQTDLVMIRGSASSFFDSNSKWGWDVTNVGSPAACDQPNGTLQASGYVALRVDSTGYIVGFDTNSLVQGTSAIGKSCWTSFAGVQTYSW